MGTEAVAGVSASVGPVTRHVHAFGADALGDLDAVALVDALRTGKVSRPELVEAAIARIPEILECHLMAGTADYLVKIAVRDAEEFAALHRRHLSRLPGVAQMQSNFSLRRVRETTEIPV